MSDDLVTNYRAMQESLSGCFDGYCVIKKPKGMRTNGGCTCLQDMKLHERSRIGHLLKYGQQMANHIEELEANLSNAIKGLEATAAYREKRTHYDKACGYGAREFGETDVKIMEVNIRNILAELKGEHHE